MNQEPNPVTAMKSKYEPPTRGRDQFASGRGGARSLQDGHLGWSGPSGYVRIVLLATALDRRTLLFQRQLAGEHGER